MVHGLLHIADGIEAVGPVWAAWAFVMERYCGYIKRSAVRSRKHAQASIDKRILETTQLEMAKMRYGLTKTLSLKPKRGHTSKDKFPDCMPHVRSWPHLQRLTTSNRSPVCPAPPEANAFRQRQSRAPAHQPNHHEMQPKLFRSKDFRRNGPELCPERADRMGEGSDL
jgi:hypothetical protein